MTIFEWVHHRLYKAGLIAKKSVELTQMLLEAGAPKSFADIFKNLENADYPFKAAFDGEIPDLESRNRLSKRSKGQFYTPESLAEKIIAGINKQNLDEILDPACGDGSFLIAAAKYCSVENLNGFDIDPYALLICAIRIVTIYKNQGWPKLELRDFLMDRPKKKFSTIVGNPPYKVNLEENYKKDLQKLYKTSEGEMDLYTFFFEASLMCLKEEGNLAMVTSHTWLVNHQCSKIREFIFGNSEVKSLAMLPSRFFSFAPGVLGVVLTAKKAIPSNDDYEISIFADYDEKTGWVSKFTADALLLVKGVGLRDSVIPAKLREVFLVMEKDSLRLGEVCKIGVGIQEAVKKVGESSQYVFDEALTDDYKPVLRGREIEAFKINWENKFIHFGSHLAYAGKKEVYENPKILYQNIRNEKMRIRLVAVLDKKGFYFKNSLSYIKSENKNYSLELLVGLLNSKLINAWFAGKNHSFHITVTQVRNIPLPVYNKKNFQIIENIVEQLVEFENEEERKVLLESLDKAVISAYLGRENKISIVELEDFLTRAAGL